MLKYEIVEIEQFSGKEAKIYTILPYGKAMTLFDEFIAINQTKYLEEILDITSRLKIIGNDTGAKTQFFKLNEAKFGENIAALYDAPNKFLRLYCIRFDMNILILGGGGPKQTRTWQDDPNLTRIVNRLRKYSNDIYKRIDSKDIYWSRDGKEFLGNLNMNENEEI